MTNEQYLIVSYFAAVAGGLVLAVLTAWLLRRPALRAVAGVAAPAARIASRLLPTWLVLLVLLGFLSVSYIDCEHENYAQAVADRGHLEQVTRTQSQYMLALLAAGVLSYSLALAMVLALCPPRGERG